MSNKGLDIGTNMIVASMLDTSDNHVFKMQRDAFYRIVPKSEVNRNSIKVSIDKRGSNYVTDTDGSFIIVGEDALHIAIERNDTAQRPMSKGVISPKEKSSLPMLKLIVETLIGKGVSGDKVVYSIPAKPVDNSFDITYHTEMMGMYLRQMGYEATPINEAFAVALSELLDDGLTGIAISCLVPGTKIYTDKGIVNIENVKEGDLVITHNGRFRPVNKVVTKNFNGLCTKLQLQGYINSTDNYKFVDNHELYIYRNNRWQWIGCEDVCVGDVVGEPIVNRDMSSDIPTMTICERVTSSGTYTKKSIKASPDVQRLIGYFLGDGSICERDSGIQFDFGIDEDNNVEDVSNILKKNFGKNVNIINKDDNCLRVKCYSKGIASWFRNNCYSDDMEKKYPWKLDRLNNSCCLSLLSGLIRSDGKIDTDHISFYNTSTNLAFIVKQLFSRIGIAASITCRTPRSHVLSSGRLISGNKAEWLVSTGKKQSFASVADLLSNMSCENSTFSDKLFIMDGFCCSRVQAIEYVDFTGTVYDLQVEEDHSFSGPYLTIHNCGAGMTNVCIVHEGDSLVEFSLTRGGDYIDQSVGNALDISPSLVQLEKEAGTDLYNPSTKIMEAVSVYYSSVINYVFQNIAYELKQREKTIPLFREPITVVVSGGLTLANGFVTKVNEVLSSIDFPIKIKEVRLAESPMTAVANGCFLAANI